MQPPTLVRLGICAEDFGLDGAVNAATVELASRGRISAASCLVDGPAFEAGAQTLALLRRAGLVEVGLQLQPSPGLQARWPAGSLRGLLARSFGTRAYRSALQQEIRRQLDRFQQVLGFLPDHVHGQQPLHELPLMRRTLLAELQRRIATPRPWMQHANGRWLRAWQLASRGFGGERQLLGEHSPECDVERYVQRLHGWIRRARDGDLLICRPATPASQAMLFTTGRNAEYRVLASPLLPSALATHGVGLMRSPLVRARIEAAPPATPDAQ